MLTEDLERDSSNKRASTGDALVNALREFIAPMVGAPKPGKHTVHVIMSGGHIVDDVSTTVTNPYGVVNHEIPVVRPS